jgi:hypothetical protein
MGFANDSPDPIDRVSTCSTAFGAKRTAVAQSVADFLAAIRRKKPAAEFVMFVVQAQDEGRYLTTRQSDGPVFSF